MGKNNTKFDIHLTDGSVFPTSFSLKKLLDKLHNKAIQYFPVKDYNDHLILINKNYILYVKEFSSNKKMIELQEQVAKAKYKGVKEFPKVQIG